MDVVTRLIDYIYGWRKYNYYLGTVFAKYMSYKLVTGVWWNNIDDHVILGGIPLHNAGHLEELKNEGISAVLSLLEDFEMAPSIYFHPVAKEDWERSGIKCLQIRVADTCGLQLDDIRQCIDFIMDNIRDHRKIYIHCKAGKGRSASVVLCYMLWNIRQQTGALTEQDVIDAYKELKLLRGEIHINDSQFEPISRYANSLSTH